jgi:hypothetical protein
MFVDRKVEGGSFLKRHHPNAGVTDPIPIRKVNAGQQVAYLASYLFSFREANTFP